MNTCLKTLQKLFSFVSKSFNQELLRSEELVVHLYANELQSVTAHWKGWMQWGVANPRIHWRTYFFGEGVWMRWLGEGREVKQSTQWWVLYWWTKTYSRQNNKAVIVKVAGLGCKCINMKILESYTQLIKELFSAGEIFVISSLQRFKCNSWIVYLFIYL